jgi:CRP-like cAMP-binding protein
MVAELLKKTAIFADLDEGELARVAEICKEQKFASQASIFKEGEPGNRLFVIVTGEVRISRTVPGAGEEALAVLKPGSCFGEMSVFDRSERSTDAIAHITLAVMGNLVDNTTPGAAGRVMKVADKALGLADPLLRKTRATG